MLATSLCLLMAAAPAVPADVDCAPLPMASSSKLPFRAGEHLDFDIDVLGGLKIGAVGMEVGVPERQSKILLLPIKAHGVASGLAASVGKLDSTATTWLRIHDLHPQHYREDYVQPNGQFWTEVLFPTALPHQIHLRFGQPNGTGERAFGYGNDVLDVVGVFYLLRTLQPKFGDRLCFDLYGSRHVWRVWGKVDGRESLTTPAGSFATLRLSGHAARLDKQEEVREVFLWLTDDARRLPVAAMGELEIGPLRALLTGVGGETKGPKSTRR